MDIALTVFKTHRPAQFFNGFEQIISEAAFADSVEDAFRRSSAAHVMKLLHAAGKRAVFIPSPARVETVVQDEEYSFLADPETAQKVVAWLNGICAGLWSKIAGAFQAEILPQPPETISAIGLTKQQFARDRYLREGEWVDGVDTYHTNASYGSMVLNQLDVLSKAHRGEI